MSVHVSNVTIKSEWTDYNKHLNMAYYVLVFDQAWEILLEKFNMGESSKPNRFFEKENKSWIRSSISETSKLELLFILQGIF